MIFKSPTPPTDGICKGCKLSIDQANEEYGECEYDTDDRFSGWEMSGLYCNECLDSMCENM